MYDDFLKKAFDATEFHRSALPDRAVAHADVLIGDSHVMIGAGRVTATIPAMVYLYVPDADAVYQRTLAAARYVADDAGQ